MLGNKAASVGCGSHGRMGSNLPRPHSHQQTHALKLLNELSDSITPIRSIPDFLPLHAQSLFRNCWNTSALSLLVAALWANYSIFFNESRFWFLLWVVQVHGDILRPAQAIDTAPASYLMLHGTTFTQSCRFHSAKADYSPTMVWLPAPSTYSVMVQATQTSRHPIALAMIAQCANVIDARFDCQPLSMIVNG